MRLLILQHVAFEGPAAIKDWAANNNHTIECVCCVDKRSFPSLEQFDCLIIMGGPMSVNDQLPWLPTEIDYIRQCINANKYVLGICLGAQLIAKALDGPVTRNAQREIGWFPVNKINAAASSTHWAASALSDNFMPLHWHGDTFAIPADATRLYESEACPNQAFVAGSKVLALQFHLEFDIDTAIRVADECSAELEEGGKYVQTRESILSQRNDFTQANSLLFALLDAMNTDHLGSR